MVYLFQQNDEVRDAVYILVETPVRKFCTNPLTKSLDVHNDSKQSDV